MTQHNKANIRKWVNALRSGEYKQTTGVLQNENGYCCLGVLCDVAVKSGLDVDVYTTTDDNGEPCTGYGDSWSQLPQEVVNWAGLENPNPMLIEDYAISLNDNRGYTFDQIADLIEKKYLSDEVAS